ncbi:MAG: pyridoxal kinase PdxY [Spirochaetaceae bacterium]|jgi:pyridoxine kinase|nr:pyridoxal kinase PdxY [Spirochaetaceae bacterium]
MAVLSIQSHVVYGYAGNTAAVFPLQRLGHEVWAINTVEFSNHTGYGAWRGQVLGAALAEDLTLGLEERGVLGQCGAVLSGYMGDPEVGYAVMGAVRRVKAANPAALYCCDPVMGDLGRGFYVKPGIPDIFKREVITLADIITPNQFELEALTGMDTSSFAHTRKAIDALHKRGPKVVLVTSFRDGISPLSTEKIPPQESVRIEMLASDGTGLYRTGTPEFPFAAGMAGSGDLTASVFLSRYLETKEVGRALEMTTASVYGIMEATFKAKSKELRIIQAQEELVTPTASFEVFLQPPAV